MTWDGGPDGVPKGPVSAAGQARYRRVRTEMMRLLTGAGASPQMHPATGWDIDHLPLGGRIKVTAAKDAKAKAQLLRWVRRNGKRRHWGALASLNWGVGTGLSVQLSAEDFAHIVGRLALLEREREAYFNGSTADQSGGHGRR